MFNSVLALVAFIAAACAASAQQSDCPRQNVIAYYPGWVWSLKPEQISRPETVTHILFAFIRPKSDGKLAFFDGSSDGDKLAELTHARDTKHKHWKIIISIGGWTLSGAFSDIAAEDSTRKTFARSVETFLNTYNLDGVDIDWEYPIAGGMDGNKHRADDDVNFTLLLKELRATIGHSKLISIALGGSTEGGKGDTQAGRVDVKGVADTVDFVNIMAYDFSGSWNKTLEHNANTVRGMKSVELYAEMGMPLNKMAFGTAFYGKTWNGIEPSAIKPESPTSSGAWCSLAAKYSQFIPPKRNDNPVENPIKDGYRYYWDDDHKSAYLYNEEKKEWVTYDDPRALSIKAQYAYTNKMFGVMIWEISQDTKDGILLGAIENFCHSPQQPTILPTISPGATTTATPSSTSSGAVSSTTNVITTASSPTTTATPTGNCRWGPDRPGMPCAYIGCCLNGLVCYHKGKYDSWCLEPSSAGTNIPFHRTTTSSPVVTTTEKPITTSAVVHTSTRGPSRSTTTAGSTSEPTTTGAPGGAVSVEDMKKLVGLFGDRVDLGIDMNKESVVKGITNFAHLGSLSSGAMSKKEIAMLFGNSFHETGGFMQLLEGYDPACGKGCGRGYLQVTGEANYEAFQRDVVSHLGNGDNVVKKPQLLGTKYAWESAVWFWETIVQKPFFVPTRDGFGMSIMAINDIECTDSTMSVGQIEQRSKRAEYYSEAALAFGYGPEEIDLEGCGIGLLDTKIRELETERNAIEYHRCIKQENCRDGLNCFSRFRAGTKNTEPFLGICMSKSRGEELRRPIYRLPGGYHDPCPLTNSNGFNGGECSEHHCCHGGGNVCLRSTSSQQAVCGNPFYAKTEWWRIPADYPVTANSSTRTVVSLGKEAMPKAFSLEERAQAGSGLSKDHGASQSSTSTRSSSSLTKTVPSAAFFPSSSLGSLVAIWFVFNSFIL